MSGKVPIRAETAAPAFGFEVLARDGDARAGRLATAHGEAATPAFMPVGTRAAVKAMGPDELWELGYRLVLANTYHLALRPGPELIEELGGVARFMGFDGAVLTDSGGFQAMSLARLNAIGPEGIRFRSHLDGSEFMLTPERAVEIQERIGSAPDDGARRVHAVSRRSGAGRGVPRTYGAMGRAMRRRAAQCASGTVRDNPGRGVSGTPTAKRRADNRDAV